MHAIIFWGGITAAVGFLGQISGTYNAMNAIARAEQINPSLVAMGFAESLTTTIYGLDVLIVSALIWFILLNRCRKVGGGK